MFGIVRLWILAFLIQSMEIDLATHTAHNLKLPRIVQTGLLANVLARSLYLCSLVVAHWFGCLIYHSISIELLNYPFPHPRSFHHEPRPQKVHININWVQLFATCQASNDICTHNVTIVGLLDVCKIRYITTGCRERDNRDMPESRTLADSDGSMLLTVFFLYVCFPSAAKLMTKSHKSWQVVTFIHARWVIRC